MSELLVPRQQPVPAVVPLLLSFTAGFVDSCTALALFGLFVAQVTGSFVLAAVVFVTHEQGAATKVLAIPVFLLAAVATTALAVIVESRGRSALTWSLGLECAALTAFLIAAFAGAPLSDPNAATVVAASLLGLFAMGTQSATVRLLMRNVASTNVMTTNTTQIAIDATELFLAWLARRTHNDAARGGRIRTIAHPLCQTFSDHARISARNGRRHARLCGDGLVGLVAAARDHVWNFRLGECVSARRLV